MASKKQEQGIITVRLDQDAAASSYIIEVADDGKGIDFEGIRSAAIEKGLLGEDTRADDHGRLLKMLFSPRFSSKAQV